MSLFDPPATQQPGGLFAPMPFQAYAGIPQIPGLMEAGNIDLTHRPVVHHVVDGHPSVSTVLSSSSEENGQEVLVPGVSPEGKLLTPEQAWALYQQTGQHLGKFKDVASADAYAAKLHGEHWTYHRNPDGTEYATFVGGPGPNTPPKAGK